MAKNPGNTQTSDALPSASDNATSGKDSGAVSSASPVAARAVVDRIEKWHAALPAGLVSDADKDRLTGLVRKAGGAMAEAAIENWYEGYHHRATTSGSPLFSVDDKAALIACSHDAASTPEQE